MGWPFFNKDEEANIYSSIGLYKDQNGIMDRYVQEVSNWKEHLQLTREFILKQSRRHNRKSVAVLGSGWLLDVPVDELSIMFEMVYLVDIKHPTAVKHKYRNNKKIVFIESDISGYAIPIHEKVKKNNGQQISSLLPSFKINLNEFDFVISCNILDQLDDLLLNYLKQNRTLTDTEEISLRTLIQQTHLNMLPKGKSCIITDLEELSVDINNSITATKPLIFATMSENISTTWTWHFDTRKTYNPDCQTWFKVVAQEI